MKAIDVPTLKFPIPWANSAGGSYVRPIPVSSQIGITDGAASLTDGFPPLNGTPLGSGGVPPFIQDQNGINKEMTQWLRWAQAGAPIEWDSAFSASIGGYPTGAIISSTTSGWLWLSVVDDNVTDPDSAGAGWVLLSPAMLYAADVGTANAGIVAISPAPNDMSFLTGRTLLVKKAAAPNTGAYTLDCGFGATTVMHPDGSAITPQELPANGIYQVVFDGSAFQVQGSFGRRRATGTIDVYVNESTGNDANAGTSGAPFRTQQFAYDWFRLNWDMAGHSANIHLVGNFTSGILASSPLSNAANVNILGSGSGTTSVAVTNSQCYAGVGPIQFIISGMTLSATGTGANQGIGVQANGANIFVGADVVFGACATAHVLSHFGGIVTLQNDYSYTGNSPYHYKASDGGIIVVVPITVTGVGSRTFTQFAYAQTGIIVGRGVTYSGGTITGQRYLADANGTIQTAGGGANYFPGNAAGSAINGGQYL